MNCLYCHSEFSPPLREVNRGNGKFCSRRCSSLHAGKLRSEKLVKNVVCAFCGVAFHKSPYRLTSTSVHFCSREHKDMAQRLEHRILEIPHYQNGAFIKYRQRAFEAFGTACQRCGYDKHIAAIDVHHKDRDRRNNKLSNLEVICRNCHAIEHLAK